jgi:hypothetical protein
MVVIKFLGGMGNQLFQRAYGYALQHRGYAVAFDTSTLVEGTHREYSLGPLDTDVPFSEPVGPTVYEPSLRFNESLLHPAAPSTIVGYFQTEKYFSDIAASVREKFTRLRSNLTLSLHAHDIQSHIHNCNSVFLHVRRQDYVGLQHFHGMPDMAYYKKALALIQERVPDTKVFVFSDDREWCLQNFMGHDVVQGTSKYEDLWLMAHCQHAVLANSSFSWWGAWLGDNKDRRIVIAPQQWFNPAANVDASDIVPERWLRI